MSNIKMTLDIHNLYQSEYYAWRIIMLKKCKWLVFTLMTLVIFTIGALSCSAAEVKATSADTIGTVMARSQKVEAELIVTGDSLNLQKRKMKYFWKK